MEFRQLTPPEALRPYVRYLWTLDHADSAPHTLRTIVDGCPGVVFQQAEGGVRDAHGKPWPALLLHGQATRPGLMQASGRFRLVGASLHPGADALAFGLPAVELTDTCLDLASHAGQDAVATLQATPCAAEQLRQLTGWLLAVVAAAPRQPDPAVQLVLYQLHTTQGRATLPELLRQTGLSERSLQRRFRQWVGVSPQLFGRICRFQATLRQLRAADYEKLSDLAFAHDYADQSHYIRGFREFAGVSPRRHLRHARELLDNLTLAG